VAEAWCGTDDDANVFMVRKANRPRPRNYFLMVRFQKISIVSYQSYIATKELKERYRKRTWLFLA